MQTRELRLVLEAVAGNDASFGELTERYGPVVLGLVYTYVGEIETARDITQEAFLKAYLSLSTLHRPDRFGSWLKQIAVNLAKSQIRQQARHPHLSLDAPGALPAHGAAGQEETALLKEEIRRCLQLIPEAPCAALVMHYLIGLPPVEAARQLGISRAAFDTRLSRGRELLKQELVQLMDEALTEGKEKVTAYLTGLSGRVRAALAEGARERSAAARELALLAARANLPRLLLDLKSHGCETRQRAAQLLGDTGDLRAADVLLERLSQEGEPTVLAELCRCLARIGATRSILPLRRLSRETADMAVHKAAIDAVKTLEAADGEPESDIPVTIDDLKAAGMEPMLLDLLQDPSPGVRVHAIDGLGRIESLKAAPRLFEALQKDEQPHVRRATAEALGAILGEGRKVTPAVRSKAMDALTGALRDPDPGVLAEAAWSIALIGCGGSEPLRLQVVERFFAALEACLTGRPGPWWSSMPHAAGAIGREAEQVRMVELMLRDEENINLGPLSEAVWRMAVPGKHAASGIIIEAIRKGLAPSNLIKALGKSEDASVIPFVLECLSPAPPFELRPTKYRTAEALLEIHRRSAVEALSYYKNAPELFKRSLQTWLECPAPDEQLLVMLIKALEDTGSAQDGPFLEAFASHDHLSPRVQLAARSAARRLSRGA